jgi:hypothetical protein
LFLDSSYLSNPKENTSLLYRFPRKKKQEKKKEKKTSSSTTTHQKGSMPKSLARSDDFYSGRPARPNA